MPFLAPDEPGSTSGGSTWSVLQGYVAKYNSKTLINTGANPIGYQYGPNAGCQVQPLTKLTTNSPP